MWREEDRFEIVEEKSTDETTKFIVDQAELFYQHTLKYKHVKAKQSTKWVHDIRRYVDKIISTLPSISQRQFNSSFVKNYNNMQEVYENGMKRVVNEDKNNRVCLGEYDVFDEFPTIDDITNKAKVEKFLKDNAYTREVKDMLNTINGFQEFSIFDLIRENKEKEE